MLNFLSRRSMRSEKANVKTSLTSNFSIGSAARILIRIFQFIMGIVVIGLYAQDLDKARKAGKYVDSKWVYAVFCGSFGALMSLVFMMPLIKSWMFFGVDFLAFFFYMVLFGIFGKMYIKENPEGNKGIIRMKNAVWIDLVNMLLWIGTAIYGAFVFWKARTARTTFTSRASEHA
ncbi:hypothetical protein K505DRAFT_17550 [Melanomma pulvis-pyrius CBS 109.77]|uniref:MARVEL domain-containing protein n=1 Tax=Melanomma pulvis-pyrius CBS 109.77 TaxID=1314802 RepID=A0A6A6XGZ0_9PLEO|nr:hypothetical protein K505DRAFT_17550 [Melanomma pulvis-pyrius CBS 109.77]